MKKLPVKLLLACTCLLLGLLAHLSQMLQQRVAPSTYMQFSACMCARVGDTSLHLDPMKGVAYASESALNSLKLSYSLAQGGSKCVR